MVGAERVDAPPSAEGCAQLALGDAAGAPVPELAVAKAHEVKAATRAEDGVHSADVAGSRGVVEDVEQPAVDDRVEGQAEVGQAQGIGDLEAGTDAPGRGLGPGRACGGSPPPRAW